jgi:quinolinate synthase
MAAPFPSLVIRADALEPQGSFAEAQAEYLQPDPESVATLDRALREKNIGVVAHFYMDPELQGVLSSCTWPHVHISDSLLMADRAVQMAEAGVQTIVVLGVDFMSENVRAMLDAADHHAVPVYRVDARPIGCSLAESAEASAYGEWLAHASTVPRSLHVIYINTSLRTKATAHARVPTITCTSSNVVQTILQAATQVPGLHVWYGPDTYMGHNLRELFEGMGRMDDAAVRAVHPAHDAASVRSLVERFHTFEQGICIVHHMFGADVAARVRDDYPDAFVTAHLEVPGEMFALGLAAQKRGHGVVGSTSDILGFIAGKVHAADDESSSPTERSATPRRLRFVLGTEAGMITAIVRKVQTELRAREAGGASLEVEIVFPVASDAIAETDDSELGVVPGVASGEGCSTAGGCATCPYMKMNSLDALMDVVERVSAVPRATLAPFHPKQYTETVSGRTVADLGGEPILHMRHFQRNGVLPDALVEDIEHRREPPSGMHETVA